MRSCLRGLVTVGAFASSQEDARHDVVLVSTPDVADPRGLLATLVVKTKVALEEIVRMYEEYYAKDSFVHIVDKNIDLKQVVNTNKCLIHLEKHGDKLLIISCIDNLLKGASGQAVHNMNLMFNLEETVGLRLKPSAF